jgi:hypothetical protein
LSHDEEGKAYGRKAKTSNRTGETPPSGIIGGASENVTLVEMCSHLATERAGLGTLHLTVGASELYPNPRGAGGLMSWAASKAVGHGSRRRAEARLC